MDNSNEVRTGFRYQDVQYLKRYDNAAAGPEIQIFTNDSSEDEKPCNGLRLQEVKIANGPIAGHFFDVDIHELPCGPIPDALAHASSGTPPDPLVIDDPMCVDFDV